MYDDVKVSISGQRQTLDLSRFYEVPSFWPFVPGKRVRRMGPLPLFFDDPEFKPRRSA